MDPQKLSTQELLQLCLESHDEAMWTEFVRRFRPTIAGVVTKCLFRRRRPSPALVDDLVQETFLKLCANNFRALRDFEFRHENGFFGFLKVVASHTVEDYRRASTNAKHGGGREEEDLEKIQAVLPSNPGSRPQAETVTLMGEIERCLAERSEEPNFVRDCVIFRLYFRQGLTAKAIAALPGIGLSLKGVESTLLRLIGYLRGKLDFPPPPRKRRAAGG